MTFGHGWGDDSSVIAGITKGAIRRPLCVPVAECPGLAHMNPQLGFAARVDSTG